MDDGVGGWAGGTYGMKEGERRGGEAGRRNGEEEEEEEEGARCGCQRERIQAGLGRYTFCRDLYTLATHTPVPRLTIPYTA